MLSHSEENLKRHTSKAPILLGPCSCEIQIFLIKVLAAVISKPVNHFPLETYIVALSLGGPITTISYFYLGEDSSLAMCQ